jgi:S-adenosylmethionine decarboxylase proenzyme
MLYRHKNQIETGVVLFLLLFFVFQFPPMISTGKHMICDIEGIRNTELLNSMSGIRQIVDAICKEHVFSVLGVLEHQFEPQGCSLVYLLSESHISIHTFPEKNYIAMDIYTCRDYTDNRVYEELYAYLVDTFQARPTVPLILNRGIELEKIPYK